MPLSVEVEATVTVQLPAEVLASEPTLPAMHEVQPPAATLVNGRGEMQAAQWGDWSWPFDGRILGADMDGGGIVAPKAALSVSSGETLTFTLAAGTPTLVTLRVLAWEPVIFESDYGTTIGFDAPEVASGDLEPLATIPWNPPPTPGDYLLEMQAVFGAQGNVAYSWHIRVTSDE